MRVGGWGRPIGRIQYFEFPHVYISKTLTEASSGRESEEKHESDADHYESRLDASQNQVGQRGRHVTDADGTGLNPRQCRIRNNTVRRAMVRMSDDLVSGVHDTGIRHDSKFASFKPGHLL